MTMTAPFETRSLRCFNNRGYAVCLYSSDSELGTKTTLNFPFAFLRNLSPRSLNRSSVFDVTCRRPDEIASATTGSRMSCRHCSQSNRSTCWICIGVSYVLVLYSCQCITAAVSAPRPAPRTSSWGHVLVERKPCHQLNAEGDESRCRRAPGDTQRHTPTEFHEMQSLVSRQLWHCHTPHANCVCAPSQCRCRSTSGRSLQSGCRSCPNLLERFSASTFPT